MTTLETPTPALLDRATAVDDEHRALARVAADRARALRAHAATLHSSGLEPLRAALLRRAGELDLAATALGRAPIEPTYAVGA